MQAQDQRQRQTVAATFHSVLVEMGIRHRGKDSRSAEWKRVVAIADTGSGPSIVKLMDLSTATEQYPQLMSQLDQPDMQLLTADGSLMKNLAGATVVRRPVSQVEIQTRAQVVTLNSDTPIIGVDVWEQWKADFSFRDRCIHVEGTDGVKDAIPFWIARGERKPQAVAAACSAGSICLLACAATQASPDATSREVTAEPEWSPVVATVDIVLAPGEILEEQFPVTAQREMGDMHCTQLLLVEGEELVSLRSEDYDPLLLEEEDSSTQKVSAVPPTLVHPNYDPETDVVWFGVPLANPDKDKDLVIRRG